MTREEWKKGWKELWIRFNTSPKLYQKSDFGLLLQLLKYVGEEGGSGGNIEVETEGDGVVVVDLYKDDTAIIATIDHEFTSEEDIEQVTPLDSEMVSDIIKETFDLQSLSHLTGVVEKITF